MDVSKYQTSYGELNCRNFNGYKPCGLSSVCSRQECSSFSEIQQRVLIVHLGALGAVLRSTSLLPAIHKKYPAAHVTWVTESPAQAFLIGNPLIDRVLTLSPHDLLVLSALNFDVALVIDKSLAAAGVVRQTSVKRILGFEVHAKSGPGVVVPANPEAAELYRLGLSDHLKFFVNQKSEQHLVHEALDLGPYLRDEYQLCLTEEELHRAEVRKQSWAQPGQLVLGINTGCSSTLPNKKLSFDGHLQLFEQIRNQPGLSSLPIVLLGGPEDTERNKALALATGARLSPTQSGLRDGLVSVAACDVVFSGDSLGMHMAIGLKKWVVAWFGPTCAHEIDLYGRGVKVLTRARCSPCWKKSCREEKMCYDQVDFSAVLNALLEGVEWHTSSSKQPSQEIFFSPSL